MIDDEGELLWFEGNQATNRLPRILGLAMGNLWDLHNHFFWPFDDSKNVQPLVRSPLRATHPPAVPPRYVGSIEQVTSEMLVYDDAQKVPVSSAPPRTHRARLTLAPRLSIVRECAR